MPDRDNENFKIFANIIKDNKTNPTEGERLVQEAPYVTKEGNGFNTAITLVDRAFYKPPKSFAEKALEQMDACCGSLVHEEHNKTYTRYEFINTTINKVEDFFDDVRYDVNLGNVSVTKELNPELSVSANVDFIGNVGLNVSKQYGGVQFDSAVQYKPAQHEGRIPLNYSDAVNGASTSIYLNNYNPGAMTSYTKHLNYNQSVGAGVSVFKEDTNVYVKYKRDNAAVSLYGSVRNPFVGVSGRVTF